MSIPTIADLKYLALSLDVFRLLETGTYIYVGWTTAENYENVADSVWQIIRYDTTSGEGGQYASNSREANKIWNSKETYF